jgi:hypothetical protein
MTLFELLFVLGILCGVIAGGHYGASFGIFWLLTGAVCGGFAGFVAAAAIAFLCVALFKYFLGGSLLPPKEPTKPSTR